MSVVVEALNVYLLQAIPDGSDLVMFHSVQLAAFPLIVNILPSKFSSIMITLTAGYLGGFF